MRKEEELRSALESCDARIADLERAAAEGAQREEGLRNSVRSARWVRAGYWRAELLRVG